MPASVSRKQFDKYERSTADTDYVEFEGRPHMLMAAEGWEEVAASIDSWLDGVLDAVLVRTGGATSLGGRAGRGYSSR